MVVVRCWNAKSVLTTMVGKQSVLINWDNNQRNDLSEDDGALKFIMLFSFAMLGR